MTIFKTITALTAAASIAGCAASPESIAPAYVSPNAFASQSCGQLNASAQLLNACLATAAAALIYAKSDPQMERVPDFYASNETALADMKRLADAEVASCST